MICYPAQETSTLRLVELRYRATRASGLHSAVRITVSYSPPYRSLGDYEYCRLEIPVYSLKHKINCPKHEILALDHHAQLEELYIRSRATHSTPQIDHHLQIGQDR